MLGCQIKFRAAAYLAVIQLYTFPFGFSIDKSIFGICRLLKFLVYTARIFSRIRIMLGGREVVHLNEWFNPNEYWLRAHQFTSEHNSIHFGMPIPFSYRPIFFPFLPSKHNAMPQPNPIWRNSMQSMYIPMNLQTHLIRLSKYRMIDYSDELIILKMPIECNETSFISLNSGSREHFAIFILLLSICVRHIINACKVETIP